MALVITRHSSLFHAARSRAAQVLKNNRRRLTARLTVVTEHRNEIESARDAAYYRRFVIFTLKQTGCLKYNVSYHRGLELNIIWYHL